MKIFFLCRTGVHTSLIAAALRLGLVKNRGELQKLATHPVYKKFKFKDIGKPFYIGTDCLKAEVYTVGLGMEGQLLQCTATELLSLLDIPGKDFQVIDTSKEISRWTIMGQFLERLGAKPLAKPLLKQGSKNEYFRLYKKIAEKPE